MSAKQGATFLRRYSYLFALTFVLVLLLPAISNGSNGSVINRTYISVGPAIVDVDGDFDGVTFVTDGISAEVLPTLDTTTGLKFALGMQSKHLGIEVSYIRSNHDGQWFGVDYSSKYRSYNFDVQLFPIEIFRLHPFGIIGLNYHTITVEDGSTDFVGFKDAKFRGADVRLGFGMDLKVHERFMLSASSVYRYGSLTSVKGFSDGALENMNSNGLTHVFEAKFFFN